MKFWFGVCVIAFAVVFTSVSYALPNSASPHREAERGIVILQYHHVGDDTPRVTSVTAAELEAHFALLKELDFTVLSLTEAKQRLAAGTLPKRAAAITFDDGWANVFVNGREVFERYRYPFTIFVNPKLMAENPRQYMSWEQLKILTEYGAEIANHTNEHHHMTWREPGVTERAWLARELADVRAAQAQIEQHFDQPQPMLAYPYGEFSFELAEALRQIGYLAFGQHSGAWGRLSHPAAIPRFPASGRYAALDTLRTKILSLPMPVVEHHPQDMVLDHDTEQVTISIELAPHQDLHRHQVQCFYGADVIQPSDDGSALTFTLPKQPPIGRSRVNCTAPSISESGRFYWYSVPLVRPDENGRWPD